MNVLKGVVIILWAITGTVNLIQGNIDRWDYHGLGLPDGGADDLEVMLCRGQYIMTCMIAGSLWGGTAALSCKRDLTGSVGHRSISIAIWESCTRSGT